MRAKKFRIFDHADAVFVSGAARMVLEISALLASSYPFQ
jgi:hypothetical protein